MKIIEKIRHRWARRSSESYCKYLRKKGIHIGNGTVVYPKTCQIDLTRPSLVSIGNNCLLNRNTTILTHDFVTKVFLNLDWGFINSSGRVVIGNNVRFGQNVMVLKGVTIGDNVFIGAGSIVTRDIPSNSIAVGAPCKVIMTLEEYFQKRLQKSEKEALDYARSIKERYNRKPVPSDFWEEFIWFVSGNEVDNYPEIPIASQLSNYFDLYKESHKAKYKSFDEFIAAAGL